MNSSGKFGTLYLQEKSIYKRTKNVIMWGAKDVLRVQVMTYPYLYLANYMHLRLDNGIQTVVKMLIHI